MKTTLTTDSKIFEKKAKKATTVLKKIDEFLPEYNGSLNRTITEIKIHGLLDKAIGYFSEHNDFFPIQEITEHPILKAQLTPTQNGIEDKQNILIISVGNLAYRLQGSTDYGRAVVYKNNITKKLQNFHLLINKEVNASYATTTFRYPAFFMDIIKKHQDASSNHILLIGPGAKLFNSKHYSFELFMISALFPKSKIEVLEPNLTVKTDLDIPLSLNEYDRLRTVFNLSFDQEINGFSSESKNTLQQIYNTLNSNIDKMMSGHLARPKINTLSETVQNFTTKNRYHIISCFNSIIYSLEYDSSAKNRDLIKGKLNSLLDKNGHIYTDKRTLDILLSKESPTNVILTQPTAGAAPRAFSSSIDSLVFLLSNIGEKKRVELRPSIICQIMDGTIQQDDLRGMSNTTQAVMPACGNICTIDKSFVNQHFKLRPEEKDLENNMMALTLSSAPAYLPGQKKHEQYYCPILSEENLQLLKTHGAIIIEKSNDHIKFSIKSSILKKDLRDTIGIQRMAVTKLTPAQLNYFKENLPAVTLEQETPNTQNSRWFITADKNLFPMIEKAINPTKPGRSLELKQ